MSVMVMRRRVAVIAISVFSIFMLAGAVFAFSADGPLNFGGAANVDWQAPSVPLSEPLPFLMFDSVNNVHMNGIVPWPAIWPVLSSPLNTSIIADQNGLFAGSAFFAPNIAVSNEGIFIWAQHIEGNNFLLHFQHQLSNAFGSLYSTPFQIPGFDPSNHSILLPDAVHNLIFEFDSGFVIEIGSIASNHMFLSARITHAPMAYINQLNEMVANIIMFMPFDFNAWYMHPGIEFPAAGGFGGDSGVVEMPDVIAPDFECEYCQYDAEYCENPYCPYYDGYEDDNQNEHPPVQPPVIDNDNDNDDDSDYDYDYDYEYEEPADEDDDDDYYDDDYYIEETPQDDENEYDDDDEQEHPLYP
jgi:hypothetical protein